MKANTLTWRRCLLVNAVIFSCGFFVEDGLAKESDVTNNSQAMLPIAVVADTEKTLAGEVLFQHKQFSVVKLAPLGQMDDLYVVHTPNWVTLPKFLREHAQVVGFVPREFAIARIDERSVAKLSALLHHHGVSCGGLQRLLGDAIRHPEQKRSPEPLIPVSQFKSEVSELVNAVSQENIETLVRELAAITTRYHNSQTGIGVAAFLAEKYRALAEDRQDVEISSYSHGNLTPQDSIKVRVTGTTYPEDVIILGSHIDSVSWFGGNAPGADDNASGTATNLEIFRVLMENNVHLERSLEIHGYGAEEVGLVGSQDMARNYRDSNINVVAMVQHDMNLWKSPNTEDKIWFVTNNTDSSLNDSLGELIDQYVGIAHGKASLSGGSSDHASWRRQGYPTAFPFENPRSYNPNIHTPSDTVNASGSFSQAKAFAKLGVAYSAHFGGITF